MKQSEVCLLLSTWVSNFWRKRPPFRVDVLNFTNIFCQFENHYVWREIHLKMKQTILQGHTDAIACKVRVLSFVRHFPGRWWKNEESSSGNWQTDIGRGFLVTRLPTRIYLENELFKFATVFGGKIRFPTRVLKNGKIINIC